MRTRFRPSPALVVASLALVIATGGTAYAAVTISGRSITNHSIAGRKMINNTLTGTQIKESGLATVPRANLAANASKVGGFTVRKIFYAPTTNSTTPKTILHLGGLVLTATCGNGDLDVTATSTVDHAHLGSEMYNAAGGGSPGFGGVDTGFSHSGNVHGGIETQPHDILHGLVGGGDRTIAPEPGGGLGGHFFGEVALGGDPAARPADRRRVGIRQQRNQMGRIGRPELRRGQVIAQIERGAHHRGLTR